MFEFIYVAGIVDYRGGACQRDAGHIVDHQGCRSDVRWSGGHERQHD